MIERIHTAGRDIGIACKIGPIIEKAYATQHLILPYATRGGR